MAAKKITFEQLMEQMVGRAGEPGMPSKSGLANCKSALRAFVKDHGFKLTGQAGSLLRTGYAKACREHRASLEKSGANERYIANRFTYLRYWHDLARTIDHEWAKEAGDTLPLQTALRELFSPAPDGVGFQIKPTARKAGVPLATLKRWLRSGEPRVDVLHYLARIEKACELEEGYLIDLLPKRSRERLRKETEVDPSPYSKRLGRLTKDTYRLGSKLISAPAALQDEWRGLFESKAEKAAVLMASPAAPAKAPDASLFSALDTESDDALDSNLFHAAMAVSDADKVWRAGELEYHTSRKAWAWAIVLNGVHYPAAEAAWIHAAAFLGWAHLSKDRGGLGLPESELTLGLFMDHGTIENPGRLLQFLDWRVKRSDGINHGTISFVRMVMMLCHPDTGYLLRRPDIGAKVGFTDPIEWHAHCCNVHAALSVTKKKLNKRVRVSRDPKEPIRFQLEQEFPLEPFHTMLKRLDRANPESGGLREAEWARDCALIAIAMSNPLRDKNFRLLTWRPDNTGELYQKGDEWRIRIPKEKFKNIRGAAHDNDYDQSIDEWAWPYIRRYLKHYRDVFGTTTDLVFVSGDLPNETWSNLSRTFRRRCRQFLDKSRGSGIHSIRHIVATHVILVTNGDYAKAAMYLHDQPETVRKHYAHLLAVVADRARREVNNRFLNGVGRFSAPPPTSVQRPPRPAVEMRSPMGA